jgi:predicted nucleotidyltransferase
LISRQRYRKRPRGCIQHSYTPDIERQLTKVVAHQLDVVFPTLGYSSERVTQTVKTYFEDPCGLPASYVPKSTYRVTDALARAEKEISQSVQMYVFSKSPGDVEANRRFADNRARALLLAAQDETVQHELETFRASALIKRLGAVEGIGDIWLFGSRSRGVHKASSDIDLLVRYEPASAGDEDQTRYKAMVIQAEDRDRGIDVNMAHINQPWMPEGHASTYRNALADKRLLYSSQSEPIEEEAARQPPTEERDNGGGMDRFS